MSKPLKLYIQSLRSTKKKRRKLACVVTALSVLVSGNVFWQLRGIGTAMVDMNLPSADDSGGDITAVPLVSSELETPDVWEATLPPLTDIAGENLARIAESQLGYTESSVNFVHSEDGETHSGYTRYGAWYGNPYGDWNTMFTYFCMDYAGVSPDDIPCGSGCWAWSLELEKAELITPLSDGSPHRGDILLMDYDADGKADRSCIVSSADDDVLTVIEGDVDGSVAECTYLPTDERFIGMVSLEGLTAEPPVLPAGLAQLDFSAESESGIRVEAHADWGAFPYDTVMSVSDISRDEAIQTAADQLGEDAENVDAVAVDITFTAPDGSELEPAEGAQVSVSIALPDEQALSDGEFSLLHVTDDGDVHEVAEADVSADGAEFTAESFSMYIVTASGINDINGVVMENGSVGGNSASNPYILYLGETLTFRYKGDYVSNGGITVLPWNQSIIGRASGGWDTVEKNSSNEPTFLRAKFTANQVGECRVIVCQSNNPKEPNNNDGIFYVKVVDPSVTNKPSHDIYLNTALGERHIDNLHEVLGMLHNGRFNSHPELFIVDSNGKPQYIKNNDSVITGVTDKNGEPGFGPYRMSVGDEIEVVSYCKASELDSLDFAVGKKGYHQEGTDQLEKVGASTKTLVESGEHIGEYRISAKFRAKETHGTQRTGISFGSDFFYIVVTGDNTTMSHADIEIADGGTYTIVKERIENNKKITEEYVYSAQVSKVNSCRIYGYNETDQKYEPLKINSSSWVGENKRDEYGNYVYETDEHGNQVHVVDWHSINSEHNGEDVVFYSDDYYNLNSDAQGSQYEWTSNFVDKEKTPHNPDYHIGYYENGKVYLRDANPATNKNFSLKDAQKAVFDVDLSLKLKSAWRISDGITTDIKSSAASTLEVSDLVFPLYRQDILDAYNKCPAHTGLDFTLAANAVMLDFDMKKDLIGSNVLNGNDYSFKLYDKDGTELATATNDVNGVIKFENVYFNEIGNYEYVVKEDVGSATDVIYDIAPHSITVNVSKTSSGYYTADISEAELKNNFTNYQTYTLPSTGGTGDLPYIIFGSAMISGALLLLYRRRKKEVAQ